MTLQLIAFYTETTGVNKWDDFVQIAAHGKDFRYDSLALPKVIVNPEAVKVHGYTYERLQQLGARPSTEVAREFAEALNTTNLLLCGHNLQFDLKITDQHPELSFLRRAPSICTYHAALRMLPELESHKLESVFAHLCPDAVADTKPHDAYSDARCSYLIACLLAASANMDVKAFAAWMSEPQELEKWPNGPKRGVRIADLDSGYLRWALTKDFPPDVAHSCRKELDRRAFGGDK